jgi:hypothetical protein
MAYGNKAVARGDKRLVIEMTRLHGMLAAAAVPWQVRNRLLFLKIAKARILHGLMSRKRPLAAGGGQLRKKSIVASAFHSTRQAFAFSSLCPENRPLLPASKNSIRVTRIKAFAPR